MSDVWSTATEAVRGFSDALNGTKSASFVWKRPRKRGEKLYAKRLPKDEATLRVLYHVVTTYRQWEGELRGISDFVDDAIRIGEERLREMAWWPRG